MKHVLLTRFCVRFAEDNPRRRYERPDWVDYRMGLFNKYCLPSVQAQTFKDFDWWFLVNPNFPGLTRNHIDELKNYGNIVHIESDWNEAQPEVGHRLAFTYNDQMVCSTRLDSDDMLHERFMETLTDVVDFEDEFLLSFKYGYIIKDGKAAPREYTVNPFISLVEYANPFRSVFHIDHTKADKSDIPLRTLDTVGWAQIDHGDNIKNRAYEKVSNFDEICVPISTLRGFPVEKS